ncbi:hypothetical protein KKF84_17855, partial [Myxococcota bacterium]|nr:hypothetical protein [Myxococcota bacterium]
MHLHAGITSLLVTAILCAACAKDLRPKSPPRLQPALITEVMLFGGTGTVGDGILKALLSEPRVKTIHVVTRRLTKRISAGVKMGKVQVIYHKNYMDYRPITGLLSTVRTVYWALGVSTFKVSKKTYRKIHIDYPLAFARLWIATLKSKSGAAFHVITSARTSKTSWFHWARAKAKAEERLRTLARGTGVRMVFYRPEYVKGTSERASLCSRFMYPFIYISFGAIRALHIGQAIIEVTVRPDEFPNGTILENASIRRFAEHYQKR